MPVAEPLPVPAGLLPALDLAALVRQPDGRFRIAGPVPGWFEGLFTPKVDGHISPDETSDFLSVFLPLAVAVWDGDQTERLMSGPFTEAGVDGAERTLEATAVRAGGEAWLLLSPPVMTFGTAQRLLQTARDEALDVERTRRRHAEREILLHCIVHDLGNPLAGLRGSLHLLDGDSLSEDDRELVEIARRQADRMRMLIRDVLGVFRQEVDAMMPAAPVPADAAEALRQSAGILGPRARLAGVAVEVTAPETLSVVAEERRLERVVTNLLENAIRHSPEGGTVRLGARAEGREVVLTVEDEGPGVPSEARGDLFQRLRPSGSRGQFGLGLYVCRLAAESWGGGIAYEDREGGGARFLLRLKTPRARLS
ncbi:MAG: HAMP domain-containing sensor histidine kinase [Bacteroidota bacterium]